MTIQRITKQMLRDAAETANATATEIELRVGERTVIVRPQSAQSAYVNPADLVDMSDD